MLNAITQSVIMLSVIMLNVIMLNNECCGAAFKTNVTTDIKSIDCKRLDTFIRKVMLFRIDLIYYRSLLLQRVTTTMIYKGD